MTSLIGEVGSFLSDLRSAFPEIFIARVPKGNAGRKSVETRRRPKAGEAESVPVPFEALVPEVLSSAPLKNSVGVNHQELLAYFRARAEFYAPFLGVSFGRISVKDQRSLWGSCTPDGNLNFNWRLALAPDAVLDYVVVHELAHRAEMNHSRDFWDVVERVCPSHKSHRRWLRKNGAAMYSVPRPGR